MQHVHMHPISVAAKDLNFVFSFLPGLNEIDKIRYFGKNSEKLGQNA